MATSRSLASAAWGMAIAINAVIARRSMRSIGLSCERMCPVPARGPGHDTVIAMESVERFEALLAAGKDGALLRFGLGSAYLKAGDARRAAEHFRAATTQDAGYSAAWKLLGKALEASAQPGEAMQAYRLGIQAAERRGDKQAGREMGVFVKRLVKDQGPPPA